MARAVKLRAFKISMNNISEECDLCSLLNTKLNASLANDRRMLISAQDPNQDEDLISDYNISGDYVFGTILRVRPTENTPNIPDSLFRQNVIHIQDLDNVELESSIIYKDHYYFLLNNNYLITNLKLTAGISRLQTYLNYFLEQERGPIYFELTPMIQGDNRILLREISSIKIADPDVPRDTPTRNEEQTTSIALGLLKKLMTDIPSLGDTILEDIISAELRIKFKKPSNVSKEQYQDFLGAYMKPIADIQNVTFMTKTGTKVGGEDILRIESVNIDTTESNKLSEEHLKQEMIRMIQSLRE